MTRPENGTATDKIEDTILYMLSQRAKNETVCPSEVARALATAKSDSSSWREYMSVVHETVDGMLTKGSVTISWKGQKLDQRSGPYRIKVKD